MTNHDLPALGELVIARRVALGMQRQSDLAKATRLSSRLLGDVENGRRKVSSSTYSAIEVALEWEPGSVARFLANGEQPRAVEPVLIVGHVDRESGEVGDSVSVSAHQVEGGLVVFEGKSVRPLRPDSASRLFVTFEPGVDQRMSTVDVMVVLSEAHTHLMELAEERGEHGGNTAATSNVTALSVPDATVSKAQAADEDQHGEQTAVEEQGEPEEP